MQEHLCSQQTTERLDIMHKELNKVTRSMLNAYLMDVHGEDGTEWELKVDLVSDIINLGWGDDCLDYCK